MKSGLLNLNTFKNVAKNNQVQALRFLFCIAIVFYHYSCRYSQIYEVESIFSHSFVEYFAPFGVISFFFLSGFYIIRRKPLTTLKEKITYWLKRFLIIYSLYFIAVSIIYFLSFTGLYGEERTVSFFGYAQNLIFLNVVTGIDYVDGAHWYVLALICLYVLAFIYDLLPKKEEGVGVTFWSVLLVISIICLLCQNVLDSSSFISKGIKLVILLLCQGWFPYAFLGIAFFLFDFERLNSWKNALLISMVALALVYICISNWTYLLVTFVASLLIVPALFQKLRFLEKAKPLIFIGNSSYSIYLLHQNIGYMFLNIFTKAINYYLSLVITLFVVLFFCLLYSFFVEKNVKKMVSRIGNYRLDRGRS